MKQKDFLIPVDKANHVIYGVVIYLLFCIFSSWIAISAVVLVGVAKELHDDYIKHKADIRDIYATIVGGLLGLLIDII